MGAVIIVGLLPLPLPVAAAAEGSEPMIDIIGIHLTGAAAVAALGVSLVTLIKAALDLLRWVHGLWVPVKLDAFSWEPEEQVGEEAPILTQLRVGVRNGGDPDRNLVRLEIHYNPGWWRRLVPGWHLRLDGNPSPGAEIEESALSRLPAGWTIVYPVAHHSTREHQSLIVIAGFSRKRVRAARVVPVKTPILVPE